MPVKYVFVTGGVVSGLGKGITAASLGRLLKARGYKVTMQKFDPYINIDPGTMNPIQHGEVFVTDDGAETDLDLGHYERFIDESLTKNSNVTTGKVYWSVLQKERRGDFGGGTVQVIPHITNEIKSRFYRNFTSNDTHIAIIEVGGTVGDIESQPFLESIRQFQHEVGHENAILIHVTLIPYIKASGELKTKPTQSSVKELQGMGIQPDIIVCRSEHPLDQGLKDKIALFCNVPNDHVLQNLDVEYLYEAPLAMEKENLASSGCSDGEKDKMVKKALLMQLNITKVLSQLNEKSDKDQDFLEKFNRLFYGEQRANNVNWEDFYMLINLLYDGFAEKLQLTYANILNEKEIQLCCLLKANMETTEIACIMGQSINTVRTRKTQIRKNIKAPDAADIVAFIEEKLRNKG